VKLVGMLCALLATAGGASAQSFRGTLTNVGRYIELRTITRDTVDRALVTTHPDGSLEFEGRQVFCLDQTCTFYRPADVKHALTSTHDLSVTTWGLGVEGVSATLLLRARTDGGNFTWPRSDDTFDAILAYADFARERYRVRLGRQRTSSGLGFYSFDGVDARFEATSILGVEGYAGRSLARALEQPRNSALLPIESFIPDEEVWLFGGVAELNAAGHSLALRYQRELWGDRAALVSERASLDFSTHVLRPLQVEGAADYDVAFGRLGKAHLAVRLPIDGGRFNAGLSGRRYLPFFELWTIWGVFSPVAYHEAEIEGSWSATPWLGVAASAGLRKYEDTDAPVFEGDPEDHARFFMLRARANATSKLVLDGEVRWDNGFGAYLGSAELSASWQALEQLRLGLYGTAFQQILEFRVGEAAVLGIGSTLDYDLNDQIGISAGGTLYRQNYDNRPSALDWNQKRAWVSLAWHFGRDPGMVREQP
jgi:hypothetical protein